MAVRRIVLTGLIAAASSVAPLFVAVGFLAATARAQAATRIAVKALLPSSRCRERAAGAIAFRSVCGYEGAH